LGPGLLFCWLPARVFALQKGPKWRYALKRTEGKLLTGKGGWFFAMRGQGGQGSGHGVKNEPPHNWRGRKGTTSTFILREGEAGSWASKEPLGWGERYSRIGWWNCEGLRTHPCLKREGEWETFKPVPETQKKRHWQNEQSSPGQSILVTHQG